MGTCQGRMAAEWQQLLGEELISSDNSQVKTSEALAGKEQVMLYFSAHWCPPCRQFTPELVARYNRESAAEKKVEVIFISSDKDDSMFKEYFREMPWLSLPFVDRTRKGELTKKFGVKGIPSLVVLDASGAVLTTNGRAEVDKYLGPKVAKVASAATPKEEDGCCNVM